MTTLAFTGTLTLAATGIGAIITLIFIVIAIVSAIKNANKQQSSQQRGSAPQSRGGQMGGNVPTADDLAARRRAQLQELARQRQGGARPSSPPAPKPANMSVVEAQRREAARRAYEQRQAQLERTQNAEAEKQRAAQLARQRQAQLAQQRQAQQRQAQAARRRQQATARVPQSAPPQPAPRRGVGGQPITLIDSRPAPVHELGHGVTDVDMGPVHDLDIGESVVHRHVADAATVTAPHLIPRGVLRLNRTSLRQAIILKELLDPPVSMRES